MGNFKLKYYFLSMKTIVNMAVLGCFILNGASAILFPEKMLERIEKKWDKMKVPNKCERVRSCMECVSLGCTSTAAGCTGENAPTKPDFAMDLVISSAQQCQ